MKIASAIVAIPFETPTRTRIAVGAISIPLNAVEAMLCDKMHVEPNAYLKMRRRRAGGKEPAGWAPDTTANGPITKLYETGFKSRD